MNNTQGFVYLFSGRSGYTAVLVRIFGTLPLYLLIETAAGVVGLLGGANKKRRFKSQAYAMGW